MDDILKAALREYPGADVRALTRAIEAAGIAAIVAHSPTPSEKLEKCAWTLTQVRGELSPRMRAMADETLAFARGVK